MRIKSITAFKFVVDPYFLHFGAQNQEFYSLFDINSEPKLEPEPEPNSVLKTIQEPRTGFTRTLEPWIPYEGAAGGAQSGQQKADGEEEGLPHPSCRG